MAYRLTVYALVSLVVAVVNLLLGYVVFKKRPNHPLNRVYGALIVLVGTAWPFSEFMLRMALDTSTAVFWARLAWTPVMLSTALIFHLVLIMTKNRLSSGDRSILAAIYSISLLFIALNFTTDTVVSGVRLEYWGYTASFGWVLRNVCSLYHFVMVFFALSMLSSKHNTSGNSIEKIQIKYVFTGLFFPYVVGAFTQVFLPAVGYTPIPVASVTTILMDGFIAYAIVRYKLLVITPAAEEQAGTEPKYNLKFKTYFTSSEDGRRAMDMYVDQIVHKKQGLCVTLTEPTEIRKKYRISRTPIIWLTNKKSRHRSIPPSDIELLMLHVKDFFKNSVDNSVVLLDGVDYLIELNGFSKVYDMIRELNADTAKTKSSLIVSVENKDDLELIKLQLKKDDIEKEISFARERFHTRKIDEESFREIVRDFEKQLIQLELEMSKLEKKRLCEDMEITD